VLRATALAIFLYVALKLFWVAHVLFFAVFLGVLFGLAVSSAVDRLQRFRIPRGIAAAIVVVGFYTLLGGFFAWMAPTIREQSRELRTRLPEAIERVQRWVDTHQTGVIGLLLGSDAEIDSLRGPVAPTSSAQDTSARTAASTRDSSAKTAAGARDTSAKAAANARDTSARTAATAQDTSAKATAGGGARSDKLKERISEKLSSATRFLFPFVSSTLAAFGGLLLITFLAVYIGAEPTVYRAGLMHLFPHKARARADEVLSAMAVALRKWLVT
jgi:predicted PurR-regulated permease PerM